MIVSPVLYAQLEEEARKIDPWFDLRRKLNGEPLRDPLFGVPVHESQPIPLK